MRKTGLLVAAALLLLGSAVAYLVGVDEITRLTALLAHVWFVTLAWAVAEALMHQLGASRVRKNRVRLCVASSMAALLCLEGALRLDSRRLGTYLETNSGTYRSPYQADRRRLKIYRPGEEVREVRPEFVHVRRANALGVLDAEVPTTRVPGEYRILALGDSFTEGFGVSAEATWVRVMQRDLAARYPGRTITAINAGVSGSDPIDEYAVLQERLLPLQPDLVIVAMNNSDLNEVLVRGGRERFRADGTLQFRDGPPWEPVYALSYVFRALVHSGLGYDRLLIRRDRLPAEVQAATGHLRAAVADIERLCAQNQMALLLVVSPTMFEVRAGAYIPSYDAFVRELEGRPDLHVADLVSDYQRDGLMTAENAGDYYWPLDLHHNERGYAVMGRTVARHVADLGAIDTPGDHAR